MKPKLIVGSISPVSKSSRTQVRDGHLPRIAKVGNVGQMLSLWESRCLARERKQLEDLVDKKANSPSFSLSPLDFEFMCRYIDNQQEDLADLLRIMYFLDCLSRNALDALEAILQDPVQASKVARWYESVTKGCRKE